MHHRMCFYLKSILTNLFKTCIMEKHEEKECRGKMILEHFLGHHKEDHIRHIVHLGIASAVLGLAITTICKLACIHHDVKKLERDLEPHKKHHLL